jgi:hypothetical protein
MQLKSEAHLGLSLMFQRDGVLPLIIMDGSKEQTMGQSRMKAREAICQVSHILHARIQQSLQYKRPSMQLVERWLCPNAQDGYGIIALNWRQ